MSTPSSPSPATAPRRFDRIDALRGAALIWMAMFHFCFDLSHAGLIQANFYVDTVWTSQRTAILSLFLLCAGAGQAISTAQGQSWARFWQRWAQVAGCALLVSAGSFVMFQNSYIYFGVLHGMAVMLILARLSAPLKLWLWPLGLLALMLPLWVQHPLFDGRALNWTGLITTKPITEDYVPVLPWLGVMWWGMAATQCLLRRVPHLLGSTHTPVPPLRALSTLGQWSLTFYMVHQPLLIGALEMYLLLSHTR
jgi:uncharacterized membrane protein